MRKLEFIGKVQPNATPELIIPGRDDLFLKPDDWPTRLAPGTVNIEITSFPEGFTEIGEGAVTDSGRAKFAEAGIDDPTVHFKGKTICVRGVVIRKEKGPYIEVNDPSQIELMM